MNSDNVLPSIYTKMESIQSLTQEVKASERVVQQKLHSIKGKAVNWLAQKKGKVPNWAAHHLMITKQMELAVQELCTLYTAKIPVEKLQNIQTVTDLVAAISELEHQEIQDADFQEILKTLKTSQETSNKIAKTLKGNQLLEISRAAMEGKNYVDSSKLLIGEGLSKQSGEISKHHNEWHLNLGLLMNVYHRTDDPELKKQISFLALNFLAKSAPVNIRHLGLDEETTTQLESMFQLGFFNEIGSYHRETSTFEKFILNEIQQTLADKMLYSKYVLTDTREIEPLLFAKFPVITVREADKPENTDSQLLNDWKTDIAQHVNQHFKQFAKNGYQTPFDPPMAVDLTKLIGDAIKINGDKERNKLFDDKLAHYETLMNQAIDEAIQEIKENNPKICQNPEDETNLKNFIQGNILSICATDVKDVGVVMAVPLFSPNPAIKKPRDFNVDLGEFVNQTGIRLGGVRGREKVFNFIDFSTLLKIAHESSGAVGESDFQVVEYGRAGPNAFYFAKPSDITEKRMFKRFESHFHPDATVPPAEVKILGQSTLELVKGLLSEIDEKTWLDLNTHPDKRQLIQTSLYRMTLHLAKAENHLNDFTQFAQSIELVHCEIATLLALVSPFKEGDFSKIYQEQLTCVPAEWKDNIKIGISKSAMNLFAGINSIIKREHHQLERVYGSGSYFEEVGFIGQNRSTDDVLNNLAIDRVDLYVGEFNHNINVDAEHSVYKPGNIQGEVESLLQSKPNTQKLTVAVDCTIDYIHSDKVNHLLQHFEKEIEEGKLNFVFFRSGQKFDMLGMDNYYGGNFYIVNNGEEQWKAFNELTTSDAYKTDALSQQWFCLVNKYAPHATDSYRHQIFENTREILAHVPPSLKAGGNPHVRISTVEEGMDPCFIDVKLTGKLYPHVLEKILYNKFVENHSKIHFRGSFGFFHTNVNLIPGTDKNVMNVRINPGLDPKDAKLIIEFLNEIAEKIEKGEIE